MNVEDTRGTSPLTFPKSARLHHRTLVNTLFDKGASLYVYPLRGKWRILSNDELQTSFRDHVPSDIGPVQMMVTIPKKKRRHAVDRVRMRRLVKEAFRKRRRDLMELIENNSEWRTLSIALVYIADVNVDFKTIDRKMEVFFNKLKKSLVTLPERVNCDSSAQDESTQISIDLK